MTIEKHTRDELDKLKDRSDIERLENMTDEEIEAAAKSDPDNPPLTDEQLKKFKRPKSDRLLVKNIVRGFKKMTIERYTKNDIKNFKGDKTNWGRVEKLSEKEYSHRIRTRFGKVVMHVLFIDLFLCGLMSG